MRGFRVLVLCSNAATDSLLDTWNQDGLQENIFEISFLRLIDPEIILKEFNLTTCKETEKQAPKPEARRLFTREDIVNQGTIPVPTLATKPLTTSSTIPVKFLKNYIAGQQRQQISELQLDKFANPQSFLV